MQASFLLFKFIQEAIPHRIQQDIITELRTPDRLRETLDVVDIVLGFLSSGGGNPKVMLKKCIDNHKMKKMTFSAKVKLLIAIIILFATHYCIYSTCLLAYKNVITRCMYAYTQGIIYDYNTMYYS